MLKHGISNYDVSDFNVVTDATSKPDVENSTDTIIMNHAHGGGCGRNFAYPGQRQYAGLAEQMTTVKFAVTLYSRFRRAVMFY